MTVSVSLRGNQSSPLTWAQVDNNFLNLANAANAVVQPSGGITASRPSMPILYQYYFDTTLGFPVWCSQIVPSIVWVNAAGVVV